MRKSGKFFLLKLLQQELIKRKINKSSILYINIKSLKSKEFKNYQTLYEFIIQKSKESNNSKLYLLIDEVRKLISMNLL